MGTTQHIPARPILSLDVFGTESVRCPTVLDSGQIKYTLNARTALAHALRHARIGIGDSVLMPTYHCPAMISPLAWLGVEPVFYPIRQDTSVDIEAMAKLLRPNTRAVLAVHYFGFIQDMRILRQFCDRHGLILIEDCAHAFFGSTDGRPLGTYGDYAIASIMKFLPIDEGGCLASSKHSLDGIEMKSGGLFFNLKSALNTLELACEHGRLPWIRPLLELKNRLWNLLKGKRNQASAIAVNPTDSSEELADYYFDPSRFDFSMSWASLAILRGMSMSKACEKRKANFLRLLEGLGNVSGARPLFSELPEGVYPLVFPLLVEAPEIVFPILKRQGVPIIRFGEYRWKSLDVSVCPISDEFSKKVFQFPCHQSLTAKEVDWLISTVSTVLADVQKTSPSSD